MRLSVQPCSAAAGRPALASHSAARQAAESGEVAQYGRSGYAVCMWHTIRDTRNAQMHDELSKLRLYTALHPYSCTAYNEREVGGTSDGKVGRVSYRSLER